MSFQDFEERSRQPNGKFLLFFMRFRLSFWLDKSSPRESEFKQLGGQIY